MNQVNKNSVWVVDDDEGILEVVKILFEQEDFDGKFFCDPKVMLSKLTKGIEPKLLLLDVFMRGVNGVDISLCLKNNTQTKHIPIILLTADLDAAEKAREAKAEGFLTKPFDIEELLAVVRGYLVTNKSTNHLQNHNHD